MTLPAPYAPLVSGGDGLDRYPGDASVLAARMAAIYATPVETVLPVRGLTHGLELAYRLAARDGGSVEAPKAEPYDRLAAIYPSKGDPAAVIIRALGSPEAVAEMAARVRPSCVANAVPETNPPGSRRNAAKITVSVVGEEPGAAVFMRNRNPGPHRPPVRNASARRRR